MKKAFVRYLFVLSTLLLGLVFSVSGNTTYYHQQILTATLANFSVSSPAASPQLVFTELPASALNTHPELILAEETEVEENELDSDKKYLEVSPFFTPAFHCLLLGSFIPNHSLSLNNSHVGHFTSSPIFIAFRVLRL